MPRNQKLVTKLEEVGRDRGQRFLRALQSLGIPQQPRGQNRALFNRAMQLLQADEDIDDILKLITELFPDNAQAIANAAHVKVRLALEETYEGVRTTKLGLEDGAYDVEIVRQFQTDLGAWMAQHNGLNNDNKALIRVQKDAVEGFQQIAPRMLELAQAFTELAEQNDLDLATVSADELLAGLRRFHPGAEAGQKDVYLQQLQANHAGVTGYAEAAKKLFEDLDAVKQKVEKFQRQKRLKTHPASTLGTYYRGDGRDWATIRANGFAAHSPLTIEQARAEAKKWLGAADTISPGTYHQDWISNNNSDKVATGNDVGCMGYGCVGVNGANRNVYRIDLAGLRIVAANEDSLGEAAHAEQGPSLVMNADTVDAATIIAVKGATAAETTFFTSIPSGAVSRVYRAADLNQEITEAFFGFGEGAGEP